VDRRRTRHQCLGCRAHVHPCLLKHARRHVSDLFAVR
jgi:hypothetical protein